VCCNCCSPVQTAQQGFGLGGDSLPSRSSQGRQAGTPRRRRSPQRSGRLSRTVPEGMAGAMGRNWNWKGSRAVGRGVAGRLGRRREGFEKQVWCGEVPLRRAWVSHSLREVSVPGRTNSSLSRGLDPGFQQGSVRGGGLPWP